MPNNRNTIFHSPAVYNFIYLSYSSNKLNKLSALEVDIHNHVLLDSTQQNYWLIWIGQYKQNKIIQPQIIKPNDTQVPLLKLSHFPIRKILFYTLYYI